MTALRLSLGRRIQPPLKLTVAVSVVAWLVAWFVEAPLSDWLTFNVFGLERGSHFGEAIAFFLLDVPKVLLLLVGIITVVTLIRGFFPMIDSCTPMPKPHSRTPRKARTGVPKNTNGAKSADTAVSGTSTTMPTRSKTRPGLSPAGQAAAQTRSCSLP